MFEKMMAENGYKKMSDSHNVWWQHQNGYRIGYSEAFSFWEFTGGLLTPAPW